MCKKLIIIGAGDFGREVSWVVERINEVTPTWNLLGFVDNAPEKQGMQLDGYPVLGPITMLNGMTEEIWVVCSIGTGTVRAKVMGEVLQNTHLKAATLIDPSVIIGRDCQVEEGSVICTGTILAISTKIGAHTIINLNCTIGHDTVLKAFCTVNPGSNVSGKVVVGTCTDIGTGSKVIQGTSICPNCTLGAGAVVVRNITEPGTYVGVPVKRIDKK